MFLAKTKPTETLKGHTDELIARYDQLKEAYKHMIDKPEIWKLLRLAALYHDTGKSYSHFQYRIKRALGINLEKPQLHHVPHNYLSPYFLPLDKLKLNKHHRRILIEAIAYHHERDTSLDTNELQKIAEEDLLHHFAKMQQELGIDIPEDNRFFNKISDDLNRRRTKLTFQDDNYLTYVLVKGLLHRLDHAASAHISLEIDYDFDLSELANHYVKKIANKEKDFLRPLQQFSLNNQNKNLILTAQTGMGKTEAALLWAGKKKTFFTVPLRVSLNALYDRVSNDMGYTNCGLLHSTSAHHLDENGVENWEVIYDQSVHFANKIIFTTIDQILKFPFKYRGYEKHYATLAHSCLVIDEIQAYNPWVVAVIIKALKMIHEIGGNFMIMTATLPQIYLDTLREMEIIDDNCLVETFYNDSILRHRFTLETQSIFEDIDQIVDAGKNKKVLVIANTVDQSIKLYQEISNYAVKAHLFHARFLQKDRQTLENHIKSFDEEREMPGIWITTQIVEASIDIDFDELYTEISPLDSLFQRFGRCYRRRKLEHDGCNIFIYEEEASGIGSVYDEEIIENTSTILKNHNNKDGYSILESQKMKMVENLYSTEVLKGTNFHKEFQKALQELNELEDHTISHQEAQKQLRGDDSVSVIPRKVYDINYQLFEQLENEEDKHKRTEIRREIDRYTCSVTKGKYRNELSIIDLYRTTKSGKYPLLSHVYLLEKDYDFDSEKVAGIGIIDEDAGFEVI